ncbi:hypothetical protein [Rubritalea marina]|uniref:hypothetical protein n=1 Tax=Rubritalea marina TaxID=361055 RepID=UPI00037E6BF7|nr:hypothetical protein [Rubritalea marina]
MLNKILKSLQISTSAMVLILGVILLFQSSNFWELKHELRGLTQRTIHIDIRDSDNKPLDGYTVSITPKYSFHKIHPSYDFSVMAPGQLNAHVSYANDFIINISAHGHEGFQQEFGADSESSIQVILEKTQ